MAGARDASVEPVGGVPPLVIALFVVAAGMLAHGALKSRVEAHGYATIDPRRSRVLPVAGAEGLAGWIDPRWERSLAADLARLADVPATDLETLDALARRIEERAFVAEVARSDVRWPNGFELELRFERPVACLAVDGEFLTATAEGLVLPGTWPVPPEVDGAPLPVLSRGAYSRAECRPGARLENDELRAALATANSLNAHLDLERRAVLGPVVIDARRAAEASLDVPGIVLDLEFGRRVWFGRAPDAGAPGELPAARKWESVERILEAQDDGLDWVLVDVRWDRPDYVERSGERGTL